MKILEKVSIGYDFLLPIFPKLIDKEMWSGSSLRVTLTRLVFPIFLIPNTAAKSLCNITSLSSSISLSLSKKSSLLDLGLVSKRISANVIISEPEFLNLANDQSNSSIFLNICSIKDSSIKLSIILM